MKHKYISVRKQILYFFLTLGFILLILNSIYLVLTTQQVERFTKDHLHSIGTTFRDSLNADLEKIVLGAQLLKNNPYSTRFLSSEKDIDRLRLARILEDMVRSTSLQVSFHLVDLEGRNLSFHSYNQTLLQTMIEDYDILNPEQFNSGFSQPLLNRFDNSHYLVYHTPIFEMENFQGLQTKLGTVLIMVPVRYFNFQKLSNDVEQPVYLYLETSEGDPIWVPERFEASQVKLASHLQHHRETSMTSSRFRLQDQRFMTNFINHPQTRWNLLLLMPFQILESNIQLSLISGILLLLVGIFGFTALMLYLINYLSKPITRLASFLEQDPEVLLTDRISIDSGNEISFLADQVNYMLDEIKTTTEELRLEQERVFEAELAQKTARIDALQKQMNPHLLFNTLNTIQGYAYEHGASEIVNISEALASLLRYNLHRGEYSSFAEEIHSVESYLDIINWRFSSKVKLSIEVDPLSLTHSVPRFLLQPIVENAVHHGFETIPQGGDIKILATVSDDILEIEISNSGKPISYDVLDALNRDLNSIATMGIEEAQSHKQSMSTSSAGDSGHGLALRNTQLRIRYLYGPGWGITADRSENRTRILIKLKIV